MSGKPTTQYLPIRHISTQTHHLTGALDAPLSGADSPKAATHGAPAGGTGWRSSTDAGGETEGDALDLFTWQQTLEEKTQLFVMWIVCKWTVCFLEQ